VSLDLDTTEEEIMESTEVTKVIRFHKILNEVRTPTSSMLLIFERDALPPHVTLGFTRFRTERLYQLLHVVVNANVLDTFLNRVEDRKRAADVQATTCSLTAPTWTSPSAQTAYSDYKYTDHYTNRDTNKQTSSRATINRHTNKEETRE